MVDAFGNSAFATTLALDALKSAQVQYQPPWATAHNPKTGADTVVGEATRLVLTFEHPGDVIGNLSIESAAGSTIHATQVLPLHEKPEHFRERLEHWDLRRH
jgi:hypothetical protein